MTSLPLRSAAMLWGYFSSALKRAPRYGEPEFRRFLRRYQISSLFRGKTAAARRVEDEQASVWREAVAEAVAEPAAATSRRVAGGEARR